MTNLENLKKLAEGLGADASGCSTNLEALNVISAALGGKGDAMTNAGAIEEIGGKVGDVVSGNNAFNQLFDKTLTVFRCDSKSISGGTSSAAIFAGSSALKEVYLPNLEQMGYSFCGCANLEKLYAPKVHTLTSGCVFGGNNSLELYDFPSLTAINGSTTFQGSSARALVLRANQVCTLSNANAVFSSNPLAFSDSYFYVPAALISAYESDTAWSNGAGRFRAIEDYTVDGTTTGALDDSKI